MRRLPLALISMIVAVAACGDDGSEAPALRCESEARSFSVPTGWGVNKQPPGDTFPSCLNLVWGADGLFEYKPLGESTFFLVPSTNLNEDVSRIVSSSGSDARVLEVSATAGVVLDKPIPKATFRLVKPASGIERPEDLIVLRTSYALRNTDPAATQSREDLIIGYAGRTAETTFFPQSTLPHPSTAEIRKALDTVAATFIPGPAFGK